MPYFNVRASSGALLAIFAALMVNTCVEPPMPTLTPALATPTPVATPVDTGLGFPLPTSGLTACAGVLIDGPMILEIGDGTTGGRVHNDEVLPMLWPPGFRAVFDSSAWVILDPNGQIFATEGQDIGFFMRSDTWGAWHTCATTDHLIVY